MYIVGVDIGGTKIGVGLVKNYKVVRKIKVFIKKDRKDFLKQLTNVIDWLIKDIDKKKIKGIGIGVPGPADYKNGLIINPPNLPWLWKFNLKNFIEKKYKIKVRMDNDVHVISLAEKHFGLGKKLDNFLVMAIGTGIGGGIVVNGKHYHGLGNAGEFGDMIIDDTKRRLTPYGAGSVEKLTSGTAIVKRSKKEFGKEMIASELEKMANKGNKKAIKILHETGKHLGVGLANLINVYDPELIILSGGVMESGGSFLLKSAKKEISEIIAFKHCNIVVSKLKDGSIIGAAALFLE